MRVIRAIESVTIVTFNQKLLFILLEIGKDRDRSSAQFSIGTAI